jgi:hypothetical protein
VKQEGLEGSRSWGQTIIVAGGATLGEKRTGGRATPLQTENASTGLRGIASGVALPDADAAQIAAVSVVAMHKREGTMNTVKQLLEGKTNGCYPSHR